MLAGLCILLITSSDAMRNVLKGYQKYCKQKIMGFFLLATLLLFPLFLV